MAEAYLCEGARTPIGRYGGALSSVRPDDMLAGVIRELVAPFDGLKIDEAVWMVDGASVAVEVPDGLSVLADRDHLRQILVNLIENATKFADGAPVQVGAGGLDSGDDGKQHELLFREGFPVEVLKPRIV